jgi:hypothetical protein
MGLIEELAAEQAGRNVKLARQLRHAHRLQALRRAERMERRAERRLIAAWRRAAQLRGSVT